MKEIIYDENKTKDEYFNDGFKEVKLGVAKEYTQSMPNGILARRKQYGLKPYVSSTIHSAMGDTLPYMATTISHSDQNFNMWDKGQLVVILSRTRLARNSIFVGSKNDTLNAFRDLLTRKTQWSDYIEEVLDLITIDSLQTNTEELRVPRVITTASYPFTISNYSLPTNDSGYVYMLVSQRHQNYTYIGTTNCIRTRLSLHNSGTGAIETAPAYLRPFALYAYVCGFEGCRRDLRYYIERKWKEERDNLIHNGIQDPRRWAKSVSNVISHVDRNEIQFGVLESELALICLFNE
jgi:predicted GIY-YIG superfamily endonuclease